jgi:hypothetical protein
MADKALKKLHWDSYRQYFFSKKGLFNAGFQEIFIGKQCFFFEWASLRSFRQSLYHTVFYKNSDG